MSFNFRPLLNKFRVHAVLNNFNGRLRMFVVLFKRRFYNQNKTAAIKLSLNLSLSLSQCFPQLGDISFLITYIYHW